MRILGLDLSLTSTGYVLLEGDLVVWHGVVGSSTLRDPERLQMFNTWIRRTIIENRLEQVAIEGYSYGSSQAHTRAFSIGELGGVIKLAIHQARLPLHVIAPGTWKKVLCGNGSLSKKNAAVELYKRYGIEYSSQDTLDAWAVAMCRRRQELGLDKPGPKVRKRPLSGRNQASLPIDPAMEAAHDEAEPAARLR